MRRPGSYTTPGDTIESIFAATKGVSGQYLSTHLREGRATTAEGVVISQATEMIAKFVVYNLRRIVFFEQLLGEEMTFWPYSQFSRLSPDRVARGRTLLTADCFDEDEEAA